MFLLSILLAKKNKKKLCSNFKCAKKIVVFACRKKNRAVLKDKDLQNVNIKGSCLLRADEKLDFQK